MTDRSRLQPEGSEDIGCIRASHTPAQLGPSQESWFVELPAVCSTPVSSEVSCFHGSSYHEDHQLLVGEARFAAPICCCRATGYTSHWFFRQILAMSTLLPCRMWDQAATERTRLYNPELQSQLDVLVYN